MKKIQFDEEKIIKIIKETDDFNIYSYKEENKYYFIKMFKSPIEEKTLKNKERKLLLFNQTESLKDDEKPINLYYSDMDQLLGYSTIIDVSDNLSNYYNSSRRTKIDLLKQMKEKVEELNNNGIYIGNFNIDSFGIRRDGSIKLRDVDDFSINGLPFDKENELINKYKEKCKKIDNVDNYSFNYFSLSFILGFQPLLLELYLNKEGLPKKYDTEENRKLLYDLKNIDDNYIKRYFIDSEKKGLFY